MLSSLVQDTAPRDNPVAALLRRPAAAARLGAAEWDMILPQARRAGLLARLAHIIDEAVGLETVPLQPRQHLLEARRMAEKHRRDVEGELDRIAEALHAAGHRIILLKGAAYVAADLPPAMGRIFSDIDILVPKPTLAAVEAILGLAGWRFGELHPYDEMYYRRWMHQIPPMTHFIRQTTLDIHHTIVPETTRIALDRDLLWRDAVPVPGRPDFATLAPADMVLHSATHLFNEGEFARGLRDLDDLNQLLRHFGRNAAFWPSLLDRARQLDLDRPLHYVLRHTSRVLETPVPGSILSTAARRGPRAAQSRLMDALFERALRPHHPACRLPFSGVALKLLYIRAHYLRMPVHLLAPHLLRKSLRRERKATL